MLCRYKVRTEIAKKQKDAEARQAVLNGATTVSSSASGASSHHSTAAAVYTGGLSGYLERALTLGSIEHGANGGDSTGGSPQDEVSRLRATLAEQEVKWKKLYETVAKENEILRSKGGESLLATQWRGRYEACMKEKEELAEKLELQTSWTNSVNASGKSMDQAYIELQEEFSAFRKKLAAIDRRRQRNTASAALSAVGVDGGGASQGTVIDSEIASLLREFEMNSAHNSNNYGSSPRAGGRSSARASSGSQNDADTSEDGSAGMTASKIKYVRHMVLQYLSCREPEVRLHMETALMTIFRMSAEEREAIESKRKEETIDTLSSITSFLGSLGT
jgi:hypothetical protein